MEPQRSVLIVDDDDTLRATLKKIFAKAGFEAQTARNAQDAIHLVSERAWDLVLADVRMPRKDGLSLLDEIRGLRPETKVIIMTAYGTEDTQRDALRRGACAYLDKPVSRAELLALCHKTLESDDARSNGMLT